MTETLVESSSRDDTFRLGYIMGQEAVPGQIIALCGDLGCGKTVFTQGFARGLGITEPVTSPTFTILQVYEEGRLPLYHFDVYRIEEPEEMDEIGYEEFFFGEGVSLVEWADLIPELLPSDCIRVNMKKVPAKGDDYREIRITK